MSRIQGLETSVSVKHPQNLLARKYRLSISIERVEGRRVLPLKNGLQLSANVRPSASALVNRLEKCGVDFSAGQNGGSLIFVLQPDVVDFLNTQADAAVTRGKLLDKVSKSKKLAVIEAGGIVIILPANFLGEQIQKHDSFSGRIPIEVVYRGALRAMHIRYKHVGLLSVFLKPL